MAKKKLVKIIKYSCLVGTIALRGLATYLYFYKGIGNYLAGDYEHAIQYVLVSAPIFTASELLLVASGVMYKEKLKKIYYKVKTYWESKKKTKQKAKSGIGGIEEVIENDCEA